MNLIGYARVSTGKQAEEGTIEIQGNAITEFCERSGHNLIAIFFDNGRSGDAGKNLTPEQVDDIENRPALGEMYQFLKENKMDGVITHKIDRWARDGFIAEYLLRKLCQMKKILMTIEDGIIDLSNIGTLILWRTKSMMSEVEKHNIRKRMADGKAVKAARGSYTGGTHPYGLKTVQERNNGRNEYLLVPDGAQFKVVRKIFELSTTMGYKAIAKWLTKRCIPTPKGGERWGHLTIRYILRNPVYQGIYSYKDISTEKPELKIAEASVDRTLARIVA